VKNSQYTTLINANQIQLLQIQHPSLLSDISLPLSISSSSNITPLIQQRPTAPLENLENQLSILKISPRFSIPPSPSTISLIQQGLTAPSEPYLKYIHNKNFENYQIE